MSRPITNKEIETVVQNLSQTKFLQNKLNSGTI